MIINGEGTIRQDNRIDLIKYYSTPIDSVNPREIGNELDTNSFFLFEFYCLIRQPLFYHFYESVVISFGK